MTTPAPPARPLGDYLPLRRTMSRDEFVRAYHTPVLLVTPAAGGDDAGELRTQVLTAEAVQRALAAATRGQLVFPVMKRMKDAFQTFVWVGRDPRCDVPLLYEGVSKLQAQFVLKPDGVDLVDVGSTNGTFVDGVRLERNKPAPMRDGHALQFGTLQARYRTPEGLWEELAGA